MADKKNKNKKKQDAYKDKEKKNSQFNDDVKLYEYSITLYDV